MAKQLIQGDWSWPVKHKSSPTGGTVKSPRGGAGLMMQNRANFQGLDQNWVTGVAGAGITPPLSVLFGPVPRHRQDVTVQNHSSLLGVMVCPA